MLFVSRKLSDPVLIHDGKTILFWGALELIGVSLNASGKALTLNTGLCLCNNYLLNF